MKQKLGIILLSIIITSQFVACKSNQRKYFINKALPKSEVSRLKKGEVLVSSSKVVRDASRDRVTFSYWRFISADAKKIVIQYEEYYENLKDKPDLLDKKEYPIKENILTLEEHRLTVYQLDAENITFQVSQNAKK